MITVHHLENSRSQRVLWLLEELELDYEIVAYKRDPKTMLAPRELKAIHPLGKSPVLVEDGLTLAETGAIVDYLMATYGDKRFGPTSVGADYWRYRHFLHYAEGSAMPPLVMKLVFGRVPSSAPFFLRPLLRSAFAKIEAAYLGPQLKTHADYWEVSLARSGWFAGRDFTAADVMMSFPLEAAAGRIGFSDRPNCRDFLARIHARPAYVKALKRGGPYAYA